MMDLPHSSFHAAPDPVSEYPVVSATPAPSRSTFFWSVIIHLDNPLQPCLNRCLKKIPGRGRPTAATTARFIQIANFAELGR